jgi:hypothetical protein
MPMMAAEKDDPVFDLIAGPAKAMTRAWIAAVTVFNRAERERRLERLDKSWTFKRNLVEALGRTHSEFAKSHNRETALALAHMVMQALRSGSTQGSPRMPDDMDERAKVYQLYQPFVERLKIHIAECEGRRLPASTRKPVPQ